MASEAKRRKLNEEDDAELMEDDERLEEELQILVDNVVAGTSVRSSLSRLRKLIHMSTTSVTAVPKPLKYLRGSYVTLKRAHTKLCNESRENRSHLADILSVLAIINDPTSSRNCLGYHLRGTKTDVSNWGCEYVQRLEIEIIEELRSAPAKRKKHILKRLLPIIRNILQFDVNNHLEIQACDFCLEIKQLELLEQFLDKHNFLKISAYLVPTAYYSESSERRRLLETVIGYYLKFHEYSKAILVAMQIPDLDLIRDCFTNCQDPLEQKQLAYIAARQRYQPLKDVEATLGLESILSNGHINKNFQLLIQDLDIIEPIAPDDIYKTYVDTVVCDMLMQCNAASQNLALSFASAFVHTGFGIDKLMTDTKYLWIFNNKEHAMLSATASLGLIHMWDIDGGLVPMDKFLQSTNDYIKSGALLAIGILNSGVRSEFEPALALLSDSVMSYRQIHMIGAILGLGLAYAGSRNVALFNLLVRPLNDKDNTMEIISLSAIALGLIYVGTGDTASSTAILQKLIQLDLEQLSSPYSRFLSLALGLIYMGLREKVDLVSSALEVLPNPYKLPAQTMLQVCAYAATGDVLLVQKLLHICSEPVQDKVEVKKSMFHRNVRPVPIFCDLSDIDNSKENTNKKMDEPKPTEFSLTQPIACLGVAIVGLHDSKEIFRIFQQIGYLGTQPSRRTIPLSIGLTYVSNPEYGIINILNKYSCDKDPYISLNAIFALGIVGAGTNNARLRSTLQQLARYYANKPLHLFLVRVSQGLLQMGKGTITLKPLKFASKVLDQTSLAGLLVVLVAFLDPENLILGKSHYLMYCLALAMEPRWLVTLDENLNPLPVQVVVGEAIDIVAKCGEPKQVTCGNIYTTPILLSHGERAELLYNDYEALVDPMEGIVILRSVPTANASNDSKK